MSAAPHATLFPAVRRFRRVLLKLSGEGLMGHRSFGLDPEAIGRLAAEVKTVHEDGIEMSLIVGGGNIFRGVDGVVTGMERTSADYMGMLATVMNALALGNALEQIDCPVRVMSAIPMPTVCEPFAQYRALHHLRKGRVVIFAAGIGNPFFTTDTAATLRAIEMACEVLLKATQVDGVYSADPRRDSTAKRYDSLTYTDVLTRNLQVMDAAAIALARENRLPVLIFSLHNRGALADVLAGRGLFTIISEER
ncbi:Uridine monophosphate kinase [invertebrate metagenome]|uniref:Uridylate kinase n=1 Tax=invertebrate metagenome TaxID=1711999 RepID=A0A484H795_9ZZZZ